EEGAREHGVALVRRYDPSLPRSSARRIGSCKSFTISCEGTAARQARAGPRRPDAPLEELVEASSWSACAASASMPDLMIGLVEKPLLRAVLRETAGNQVRAAQILGINRNTLRKKLVEHGIDPDGLEA